jgi:hypothetical protein
MSLAQLPDEIAKAVVPIFAIITSFLTLDNVIKVAGLICVTLQAIYWVQKIIRERKLGEDSKDVDHTAE